MRPELDSRRRLPSRLLMVRKFLVVPLLLTLQLLPVLQASEAKTYRWVDEKGRVHYSDVAAPKAEQVLVKPGSGVTGVAKSEEAAGRAEECQLLRERLSTYETASTITETDALGNQRAYTDAERQKLLTLTREQVQAACEDR